jgi:hypothetical protein
MSEAERNAGLGLDEYLSHSTSGGGDSVYKRILKKEWKKEGEIEVWLHTRGGIATPVVGHGWYAKRSWEDRQTGETVVAVWSEKWNCWEDEEIVRRQYKIDADDNRLYPPVLCPMCMLIDFVGRNVRNGKIGWCEPLFEWQAGRDHIVLHAGGITNMFGSKDLSAQQLAEMKRAGIYQTEAWKENAQAKFAYIFRVIVGGNPDECKVAIEPAILGDAMRVVIRDEVRKARRRAASDSSVSLNCGNPLLEPYPFSWRYTEKEKNFAKRYSVLAINGVKPSPRILEAITVGELPDISALTAKGNCAVLRAQMEHAAVGKAKSFPWGKFFEAAEKAGIMHGDPEDPAIRFEPEKLDSPKPPVIGEDRANPIAFVPCEHCGADMGERDVKCAKCGTEYETGKDEQGDFVCMAHRPCGNCGELVVTTEKAGKAEVTCIACLAVHDAAWRWTMPAPAPQEPAKAPARRRGGKAKVELQEPAKGQPEAKAEEQSGKREVPPDEMNWG